LLAAIVLTLSACGALPGENSAPELDCSGTQCVPSIGVSENVMLEAGELTTTFSPPSSSESIPIEFSRSKYALTPGCGNGMLEVELGETCDDGNINPSDGCDSDCQIDPGYICYGERPSLCTLPDQSDAPATYGTASHTRSLPPISPFIGREFWTAFPRNLDTPSALVLKIAGDPGTTGSVYDQAGASIASFTIPAGGIATVSLTIATYHITASGSVTNQGVRVTADAQVRVLGTNESTYTTDTWAVWATEKLGTEHIVLDGASQASSGRQIVVIGTVANTAVTIRDSDLNQLATFTLGPGQTYRYQTSNAITGYSVTSDNPIGVISGVVCTNDVGSACDMTAEQLAPIPLWARDYVVAPTFENGCMTAKANHVVVASRDNTMVVITDSNGTQQSFTLNARQSRMFATATTAQLGYFINADKPIGVVSNIGDPGHSWDPALVTWPPIDGYVSSAKMPVSGHMITYSNYLTVVTRTGATSLIRVNGAAVPEANWKAIHTTGYSFARVAVPQGDNTIEGLQGVKFGAVAVGGSTFNSYGYSSPYDIAVFAADTTCDLGDLAPDYEAPFVGSESCDADDLAGIDDEDAIDGVLSVRLDEPEVSLTVPCNDNYYGTIVGGTVHGFIDFNLNGTFEPEERASAPCNDPSATTTGSAQLTWTTPTWNGQGFSVLRLRICDSENDCSAPTGLMISGEVEDHLIHIGLCGDGYHDTFEECDDGGLVDHDGCSSTCQVEEGFTCVGSPSECLLSEPPTIDSPSNDQLVTTATPEVSGHCVPGATVRVKDTISGEILCTAPCEENGTYACTTSELSEGAHGLVADQQIGVHTSVDSNEVSIVRVDIGDPPEAPVITHPADGSALNINQVPVGGTCEPGALVQVYSDLSPVCSALCTLEETFSCTTSSLSDGSHALTAKQTDVGGNLGPQSEEIQILIDTIAPAAPTITFPLNGEDPLTSMPTITGACEPGATVNIYENLSIVICSTQCQQDGSYACKTQPLPIGSHTIRARQYDIPGNEGPFSNEVTFPITKPPLHPPVFVNPAQGASLPSTFVEIELTCQAGTTVEVFEGELALCSGVCAADETFSCTQTMSASEHTLTATQTDEWQTSHPATPITFTLNKAPIEVTVSSSSNPSIFSEPVYFTASIAGATGTVQFQIDGQSFGAPVALEAGVAQSQAIETLLLGNHEVTAIYVGDANYLPGTGTLVGGQTVEKAPTATSLTATPATIGWGETITLVATVVGLSPATGTPTGQVAFYEDSNLIGIADLSEGQASIQVPLYLIGSRSLTAVYGGDSGFLESNSEAAVVEVTESCVIEGSTVAMGTMNPENECEWCDPSVSASSWSAKAKGAACADDELSCTSDVCDGAGQCTHTLTDGCLIGGICVGARESSPDNDCLECNPAYLRDDYSEKPRGEGCSPDGMCDGSGQCWPKTSGECVIAGVTYASGASNPANVCQYCEPAIDPSGWVNRTHGAACTDDGLTCTSDSCDGAGHCAHDLITGCMIEGTCVTTGAKAPDNMCQECNPLKSTTGYVPSAVGSHCEDDGNLETQDVCDDAETCVHEPRGHCEIDGQVFDDGSMNPENACQWCDSRTESQGWSNRAAGSVCADDGLACTTDVCDGAGMCGHELFEGCLIEGRCIGAGGSPTGVDCMECNPEKSTSAYSVKPQGESCGSENGDEGTLDVCDENGQCTHAPKGQCRIDGKLWPEGASNPMNECEVCSPTVSYDGWTPRVAGYGCASDGLECTVDVCDGAGICTHELSGGCAIDGQCVASGAQSAADPCMVCDPTRSTTEYVLATSDECSARCQEQQDCESGHECIEGMCRPEPLPQCTDGTWLDGQCIKLYLAGGGGCSAGAGSEGALLLGLMALTGMLLRRRVQ
jgi:cysteine-rich repeat protein